MVCQYLGRALLASLGAVIVGAGAAEQFRATRLQPAPSAPYQPGLSAQIQPIQVPSPTASSPVPAREILNKYDVTCHNARLKTAGLLLDALDVGNVGADADRWEKVAGRLRTREMPPSGRPWPDQATYDALATEFENSLDAAAAAHVNPGHVAVHRLSRAEYANPIRDLLGLQVDAASLPMAAEPDQHGFENIANLLSVSTPRLERYHLSVTASLLGGG